MHEIEFVGSGPALSEEKISRLESQLGTALPADYRSFMLSHNGGSPSKASFRLIGFNSDRWIDWLCWIDENLAEPSEDSEVETLAFSQYRDSDVVPADALIVGASCRDDLILLFLGGTRRGQVFLKCMDELPLAPRSEWAKKREEGLHFVANSFADFLDLLKGQEHS